MNPSVSAIPSAIQIRGGNQCWNTANNFRPKLQNRQCDDQQGTNDQQLKKRGDCFAICLIMRVFCSVPRGSNLEPKSALAMLASSNRDAPCVQPQLLTCGEAPGSHKGKAAGIATPLAALLFELRLQIVELREAAAV